MVAPRVRDPNPGFDTVWYYHAYPDASGAGWVPIEHFVLHGGARGRLPFRGFEAVVGAGESVLDAYRRYMKQRPLPPIPRRVWGAAADAKIRCVKEPSFGGEVAILACYSPDGRLKSHVPHYVESLRRAGVSVVLVVNTDSACGCFVIQERIEASLRDVGITLQMELAAIHLLASRRNPLRRLHPLYTPSSAAFNAGQHTGPSDGVCSYGSQ